MDAEQLAREALGEHANDMVVQRLARVTLDCPLITVVGGSLIRRGQLDPAQLDQDDQVRETILGRFRDALVSDPLVGDPETRTAVLDAVAALQPVRTDDDAFSKTLAQVIGKPFDVIHKHLRGLEEAGVLRRRGASIRVIPDLLGDVVLVQACWDSRSSTSTGYLDRVRAATEGEPLQHLFINASRVDWQVQQKPAAAGPLVDELWALIEADLKAGNIQTRRAVLRVVTRAAYYQPERTIALARWIIDNPTDDPGPEDPSWPYLGVPTYQHVLNDLPAALKHAGYTFDSLPGALELLWQLAQNDDRPTNQITDHPRRVIADLAEFQLGKPIEYNNAVVDIATTWFDSATKISPFDVLRPILATEGSRQTYQQYTLTFQPFALNVDVVHPIRERVIQLALAELGHDDVRRAAAAADTISAALHYPIGMFGRGIADDERKAWTPGFVDTIHRVGTFLGGANPDSVVLVAIREALNWHANYSTTPTRDATRAVFELLRHELTDEVALIIHDGWGHLIHDREPDYTVAQQQIQERLANAVEQLAKLSDEGAVALIVQRLAQESRAFGPGKAMPGPLVGELVKGRPSVAARIVDLIVTGNEPTLDPLLPVVLAAQAELDATAAVEQARELLALNDQQITRSVAQALGWNRGLRPLAKGEHELLLRFARNPDVVVRHAAVVVGQRLAKDAPAIAAELILAVEFSDDAKLADDVFMSFSSGHGLPWAFLTDAQHGLMRTRLVHLADIGHHWINKLIAELSATEPSWVIALLRARIEFAEKLERLGDYRPTPYHWSYPLQVRQHANFTTYLRQLHAWIAGKPDSWIRARMGAELFAAAAGRYDEPVLNVLTEALRSNSRDDHDAVASIIGKGQRTLIWDSPAFVRTALHAAARVDKECRDRVASALWGATISGSRTGTPGKPFQEDIELRDRSREIAQTLPHGSDERRFYEDMARSAESQISQAAHEDSDDGRDW